MPDNAPQSASPCPQEQPPADPPAGRLPPAEQAADEQPELFLDCLKLAENRPFIQVEKIAKSLKVSVDSAALLIQRMEKEGTLQRG